jgi:hypothetical protein
MSCRMLRPASDIQFSRDRKILPHPRKPVSMADMGPGFSPGRQKEPRWANHLNGLNTTNLWKPCLFAR